MMKVSIFTDASVRLGKCGFAFYIGCKSGKIQKAGKLKAETNDTSIAELHCIANAVYTLKRSKFVNIDKVFIYCDNKSCVQSLNGSGVFRNKETQKVTDEIQYLMIECCIKFGKTIRDIDTFFEINHIKAHTGNSDIFSKINAWCDTNAKLYSKPLIRKPKRKKSA